MHAGCAGWADAELRAAWHSVSAASSDLTQHAVIGSQSANADGNNTNHRNFYRFSLFRQILSLSALFLSDVEKKKIERDGKQQQENKIQNGHVVFVLLT